MDNSIIQMKSEEKAKKKREKYKRITQIKRGRKAVRPANPAVRTKNRYQIKVSQIYIDVMGMNDLIIKEFAPNKIQCHLPFDRAFD